MAQSVLGAGGYFFSEEVPFDAPPVADDLQLVRPFVGPLWWNSLYWTNFPPLTVFNKGDEDSKKGNTKLKEQYVTKAAAREDLCANAKMSKKTRSFAVECMQYEGVKDLKWRFPLQEYIPLRDNHKNEIEEARRFWDNGVIHMGLNAAEFSAKVMPVEDLDAVIHMNDYCGNPTWGYYKALMRIGGWPYEITKIGTFEGLGEPSPEKGVIPHMTLDVGFQFFDDQAVFQLLEGGPTLQPTGPNGEMEFTGNSRKGCKYWAQLRELDWLGPKKDESKLFSPEIPVEKGYVWFIVEDSIIVPSTGQKGVRIRILEEGIVPCWLDLPFLQVWAGDIPLGYLNEADADEKNGGTIRVNRTLDNNEQDGSGNRVVTFSNENATTTLADPQSMDPDGRNSWIFDKCTNGNATLVDFGWMIRDMMYKGCTIKCGPRPGAWAA